MRERQPDKQAYAGQTKTCRVKTRRLFPGCRVSYAQGGVSRKRILLSGVFEDFAVVAEYGLQFADNKAL